MDNLMKLLTTALEWSSAQGGRVVSPKMLEAAAELLTLRRKAIEIIDTSAGDEKLP